MTSCSPMGCCHNSEIKGADSSVAREMEHLNDLLEVSFKESLSFLLEDPQKTKNSFTKIVSTYSTFRDFV